MQSEDVIRQAGLGRGSYDPRVVWGVVLAILLLYAAAFFAFYPVSATNDDEARYIRQARLMLEGRQTVTWIEPLTGETIVKHPSLYPVGTAALMAPFLWLFGERGAWVSPFLSLLAGVLVTARWLADEGRSPLWSLLVLGFPASLVLGRVSISDAPSLAVVALGLWLFWRGLDRGAGWWLASGFAAGASMVLRETNALPFVAFYAGTVLRRETKAWALVVGGLAGVSVRLVSSALAYDDPFYARGAGPLGFGLHALADNWLLHLLALFVFVPGGLVFACAYRGRRRPELVVGVLLFVVLYLVHWFGEPASSFAKRLVVELRYFAPLLPILAFAMGESVPRLWRSLAERVGPRRAALETASAAALVLWIGGLAVASVAVHWTLDRWGATQVQIRRDLAEYAGGEVVLVTNWWGTKKFLSELDRRYQPLERKDLSPEDLATLVERYGGYTIALLDRSDSEYWLRDQERNAAFVESIEPPPALALDRRVTSTDRLRVWRVGDAPNAGREAGRNAGPR